MTGGYNRLKRFLWTYGIEKLPEKNRKLFADRMINKYDITDLFFSTSKVLLKDHSCLKYVIQSLSPLRVHAMVFQDSFYLDLSPAIEKKISEIISLINNYNLNNWHYHLHGIHLDLEPHARADFKENKNGDKNLIHSLFTRYSGLLKVFRNKIDVSLGLADEDFLFSAATGWWYETRKESSTKILGKYLDAIVPMAYNSKEEPVGGSFERLKNKMPYEKWDELNENSGFIIGLGFCEYENIFNTAKPLEDYLKSNFPNSFKGLSFFSSYDLLEEDEKLLLNI